MTVSCSCSAPTAPTAASNDGFKQLFTDFKGIGSAIQSGDLSTAQTALTTFQTDLQNNTGKNPLSRLFSKNSNLTDDLKNLQAALQSNDPAKAQDAFKTLIKDMQSAMKSMRSHGHHHHHHVDNDGDADDSANGSNTTSTDSATGPSTGTAVGSSLNVQA